MKKFWITAGALTVFFGTVVLNGQTDLSAETEDPSYEKIAQEAERNRELLEIWKDHVKTLTKERDQAYQELERMRSGAGVAQFGGVETAPLLPSPEAAQQIDSLQSEVSRLQLELQRKAISTASTTGGSNRELQMQLSALQSQYQQTKKELTEAKNDKERALQEKEKALSRIEELRASGTAAPQPGDEVSKNLQKAYDIQKKRYEDLQQRLRELEQDYQSLQERESGAQTGPSPTEVTALRNEIASLENENLRLKSDLQQSIASSSTPANRDTEIFVRQARELQYENDSLKAQVEKLKVVEKELASARAYFTPMVKELQEKNDDAAAEKASLASEIQNAREETNQVSQKIQMMNDQNQKLGTDLQTLRDEQEEWAAQMETYKSQLQMAAADKEKFRAAEEEFRRSQAEIQSLQKAIADHGQVLVSKDAEISRLNSQVDTLEKTNRQIESREADNLKSVERYQTALQANLTDMKNLKSNFEAYLESLVASFDERQR